MKKLLLILICLLIYSPSYSKWEEVFIYGEGDVIHIDKDRIRFKGENVLYWVLNDLRKTKDIFNAKSILNYYQVNCDEFQYKLLEEVRCLKPMGLGGCEKMPLINDFQQWSYPIPNSITDVTLNKVCKLR